MEKYTLGRKVNHDERSKNFTFNTTNIPIVDVTHSRYIPILDQGTVGSCTGNAGIGAISSTPFLNIDNTTYTRDEKGALKLYSDAEKTDGGVGYPPEDNGSSGLSIAKALLKAGLISSYQHTFSLDSALKALTRYPIIVGINWYNDMFHPDTDGRVHPTGPLEGGHEVQAYRIDTENGRVWFHNSWGSSWGVSGDFYLTWADLSTLLSQKGDATVLIPPTFTPPAPVSLWKYFTPTESTGKGHTILELDTNLVNMLDKARGIAGVAFTLTSGMRTAEENKAAGGVADSAHLRGLAADIATTTATRQKILTGLLTCGVPVFIEDAVAHIHVDIDASIHPLGDGIVSNND